MGSGYAPLPSSCVNGGKTLFEWFADLKADFIFNFIEKNRWKMLLTGFENTLTITILAGLMGIAIGIVVAIIRSTWDKNHTSLRPGVGKVFFGFVNWISKVYLTVFRGTPLVLQLLIMYFVIFANSRNDLMIAIIAFGINSGAYVAEIFRAGIMSIHKGQFEAGRSLGFNYVQTMLYIIAPQMIKNVLPALLNEFIALLKETSVAGYVTVMDLTYAANRISAATYSPFMPLVGTALIYLAVVMFFTWIVGKLERRLRTNER